MLAQQRLERGKGIEHLFEGPVSGPPVFAGHAEVFRDTHFRKQPPAFRHHRDAGGNPLVCAQVADIPAFELYRSRTGRVDPGNRAEQRCLAGAVGANNAQYFAARHGERNVTDRRQQTVAGYQSPDLEQVHSTPLPR